MRMSADHQGRQKTGEGLVARGTMGKPVTCFFTENGTDPEIHDGLQLIENWNSANDFIFYGRGGDMATNRLEDQEIAMLALHLLQLSLVSINTLMVQQIFTDETWFERMTPEDFRALTPLTYAHINPYGTFELDMQQRLPLEAA